MPELRSAIDLIANETRFSGVVWVDDGNEVLLAEAYGLANRAQELPNRVENRFALASGTKGITALTIVSLFADGLLSLATPARSVLGRDLPLIDDEVTVEHLLAHRSGIGDYFDEDSGFDINEHILPIPVHELEGTERYLRVLDGHPAKFAAGQRFSYCNGGYVVLALIAERVTGILFEDLASQLVCLPAGMTQTGFIRSDELPGGVAVGYLHADGLRTNVFHLPVLGSGDGGIYSTAADVSLLWTAMFAGSIVPARWVEEMVQPRSVTKTRRYGLGFWLHATRGLVMLEGSDAGVSFRSVHDPTTNVTHSVLSNTSEGAWPITRRLDELLDA